MRFPTGTLGNEILNLSSECIKTKSFLSSLEMVFLSTQYTIRSNSLTLLLLTYLLHTIILVLRILLLRFSHQVTFVSFYRNYFTWAEYASLVTLFRFFLCKSHSYEASSIISQSLTNRQKGLSVLHSAYALCRCIYALCIMHIRYTVYL